MAFGDDSHPRGGGGGSAEPNARTDGLDGLTAGLVTLVASHTAAGPAQVAPGARAAEVLAAELASRERRQARRRRIGVGAGAALVVIAAAGLTARALRESPATAALSYTVDGAAPPQGGFVRSSPEHQPVLAFSDGTRIQMLPRARARVVGLDRRGARVVLEEGRAHVEVVHRPGAEWLFEAGGFLIHVHGTAFFVEWNTAQARLDLRMENGVISVEGPPGAETVVLRAGQSYSVSLRDPAPPRPVAPAAPAAARVAASPAGAPSPGGDAPVTGGASAPAVVGPGWTEGLADGHSAAIVADAERRGLARVLLLSSSEDLAALADAARYQRRDDLARRALLAQRRRFPRSVRAQDAAFLLGRLDDGAPGRAASALSWYDRYLSEAPRGTYAGEALGRKMMALQRERRQAEGRAVAVDYLRRFPGGIYAHAARALVPPAP